MRPRLVSLAACIAGVIGGCALLVDTSDLHQAGAGPPPGPLSDARVVGDSTDIPPDALGSVTTGCPAGALFCDDFEAGLAKWEPRTGVNGKAELVSDVTHAGKGAFRATTAPGTTADFLGVLRRDFSANLVTGLFVFHAWMRFEGKYADQTSFVKLRGVSGGFDMNMKILDSGRLQIDADVPASSDPHDATEAVPLDRWVCVEWQSTLGTPGHSKLILDGKTVIDADENTVPPDGYDQIEIGFVGKAGPDQRVFMDDIVLATAPIGCP